MKQDPKEVLEMLNILLEHTRPFCIANTTIIEDIKPDSVNFVIRAAMQCIDQMSYKTCTQQLIAAYGIFLTDKEVKPCKD